jgi:ABC-type transporter Mla subunit MlaD
MSVTNEDLTKRLEEAIRRMERMETERAHAPHNKVETLDAILEQLSHVVKRHETEITDFRKAIQSIAQLLEGALGATGLVRQVNDLTKTVAANREDFIELRNRIDSHGAQFDNARALEPSVANPTGTIINQQSRLIELALKVTGLAAALLAAAALGFGIKGVQPNDKPSPAPTVIPSGGKP